MAYIYKITNDINQKIYIGKTEKSLEKRFHEHYKDAYDKIKEHRPLYAAIRKYGIEHFHIELIEETFIPEEREIYWIEYYQSFKNGYNATRGGDGRAYLDYDLVIATYKELKTLTATAEALHINRDTVAKILTIRHENKATMQELNQQQLGKPVNQYNLQGEYLQTFPSLKNAAISIGIFKTEKDRGCIGHIKDVCLGKRKTAYGFIWKSADTNIEEEQHSG